MSRFHNFMRDRGLGPQAPNLADAAIAIGLPVFPCDAQKRPLTPNGYKDATSDPAAIRRMFAMPGAAMIGMPTGEVSGVVAVDVDVKDQRQGMDWLNANSHRMPQTRTIRTGSGGLHIYLSWPGQRVKNSASKIAPGIDVRGDGGYVIVPPSPGYAVADNAPIADIPDWLLPVLCPPEAAPAAAIVRQRDAVPDLYTERALQEELARAASAPDGTRNHTIHEVAVKLGTLVGAGMLSRATVEAELGAIAAQWPNRPKSIDTIKRGLEYGIANPRQVPEREAETLPPAVYTITQQMIARAAAQKAPKAARPDVTPDLMDVPGALRLFIDHCERTAISRQPLLALAAGICMVGALAGRRYRTSTDLRTNIYAVGIADSGAGKDHARKQIRRCLYAANLVQYLGGADIASGSAMRTALMRHPAMLFQIDEFGDWLGSVLGDKAATHKKQIAAYLKELYSSANTVWAGTEYADQSKQGRPREDVQQPNACLYGTTTPGQLWAAVGGANLHDGLMARLLLFVSPCSYPDEQDPDLGEPPGALLEALQAIAAGPPLDGAGDLAQLMLATTAPQPYTVPETPEASAARRDLRRHQLEQQRQHEGTYVTSIAGRLAENAMKLALVRAISRDPAAPVIQAADVAWGRTVAQHCVDTLLREAARHVADNDYEAKLNRALDYIRKHGPITSMQMFRKGWRLPERERDEILRSLVNSGLAVALAEASGPAGGRPATRYAVIEQPSADGYETPFVGTSDAG